MPLCRGGCSKRKMDPAKLQQFRARALALAKSKQGGATQPAVVKKEETCGHMRLRIASKDASI